MSTVSQNVIEPNKSSKEKRNTENRDQETINNDQEIEKEGKKQSPDAEQNFNTSNLTSDEDHDRKEREPKKNGKQMLYICVVVIIAIVVFLVVNTDSKEAVLKKAEEIYELRSSFPRQSTNLWTNIVSGVKDYYVSDPRQPCVLLLLVTESNTTSLLHQRTAECIAKHVASKVTSHNNSQLSPALVDSSTVVAEEYGDTLQDFRNKLLSHKALILTNLQNLSGSLAQSLHVLCDRYNPAVPDALVIFTFKSGDREEDETNVAFVTRILSEKWEKDIPANKLPALITRLTSRVVSVTQENDLPPDCLH